MSDHEPPEASPRESDPSPVDATGSVADRTQVEVERHLGEEGFTGQFGAREGVRLLCFTCHREFSADELDADLARRVEGESDPSDMAIVIPVVCLHCHTAGTLSLQFGPLASAEESEVIAALSRVPSAYDPTPPADSTTTEEVPR